jgi:hypothetical protein
MCFLILFYYAISSLLVALSSVCQNGSAFVLSSVLVYSFLHLSEKMNISSVLSLVCLKR